jgi:hypothetical protein
MGTGGRQFYIHDVDGCVIEFTEWDGQVGSTKLVRQARRRTAIISLRT